MGQQEVYNFLKRKRSFLKTSEIARELKLKKGLVLRALTAMFKYHEVIRNEAKSSINSLEYAWRIT